MLVWFFPNRHQLNSSSSSTNYLRFSRLDFRSIISTPNSTNPNYPTLILFRSSYSWNMKTGLNEMKNPPIWTNMPFDETHKTKIQKSKTQEKNEPDPFYRSAIQVKILSLLSLFTPLQLPDPKSRPATELGREVVCFNCNFFVILNPNFSATLWISRRWWV